MILNNLTAQIKASPRLRMNLNFHQSLDEKCHRFLNAVKPGANIPIHRHPEKEESFVVLRGRIRVITYNDDGTIIDDMVLNPSEGRYGVNVGKNVWHTVEALEPGSVIFECKEGPFVEHEVGILEIDDVRCAMTPWFSKNNEEKDFGETNHRNSSRHRIENHLLLNWLKQNRKLLNAGKMKESRVEMFEKQPSLGEQYKHVNQ